MAEDSNVNPGGEPGGDVYDGPAGHGPGTHRGKGRHRWTGTTEQRMNEAQTGIRDPSAMPQPHDQH